MNPDHPLSNRNVNINLPAKTHPPRYASVGELLPCSYKSPKTKGHEFIDLYHQDDFLPGYFDLLLDFSTKPVYSWLQPFFPPGHTGFQPDYRLPCISAYPAFWNQDSRRITHTTAWSGTGERLKRRLPIYGPTETRCGVKPGIHSADDFVRDQLYTCLFALYHPFVSSSGSEKTKSSLPLPEATFISFPKKELRFLFSNPFSGERKRK